VHGSAIFPPSSSAGFSFGRRLVPAIAAVGAGLGVIILLAALVLLASFFFLLDAWFLR